MLLNSEQVHVWIATYYLYRLQMVGSVKHNPSKIGLKKSRCDLNTGPFGNRTQTDDLNNKQVLVCYYKPLLVQISNGWVCHTQPFKHSTT